MVEVSVVIVCLVLLVVLVLPMFAKTKRHPSWTRCVSNLKDVGLAARIFATDNEGLYPWRQSVTNGGTKELLTPPWRVAPHFQAFSNELSNPRMLWCPDDQKRQRATNFATLADANVSYFIGLDATEESPQSILSGDRHLTVYGADARPGLLVLTATNQLGYSRQLNPQGGNLLFGDGSVQRATPALLNGYLKAAVGATNANVRLLIP
jgi:prepilin-type processing-associated H-X9-DG protein